MPGSGLRAETASRAPLSVARPAPSSVAKRTAPSLNPTKASLPRSDKWRHILVIALALAATIAGLGQGPSADVAASDLISLPGGSEGVQPRVLGAQIGNIQVQLPEIKSIDLPPIPTKKDGVKDPYIAATNVVVLDDESKLPLYAKGADQKIAIASTTKIATAVVALKHYKLTDRVAVSASAASAIGSAVGFRVGETATIEQLLYGLLMVSGNDAAYALAEHMAKPEDTDKMARFINEMNVLAAELEMDSTLFKNPAGLDDSAYSTANDMAKLMSAALKDKTYTKMLKTLDYEYTSPQNYRHVFKSSNRLIGEMYYEGTLGGKTGFTPETAEGGAGHCLVTAATRNGHTIIAAVFKTYSNTPQASAEVARAAMDYGFNNFTWQEISR